MENVNVDKLNATVQFLAERINFKPEVAIVVGSGLGGLVDEMKVLHEFEYGSIPHFPVSTVKGHGGKLLFGEIEKKKVVMLSGRFHFYEGYTMQEVTFPIRVMRLLGAELLMVSNAAGGMNPAYSVGDLMVIKDHINLFPEHPLRGKNIETMGPRFPDMTEPYELNLVARALEIAKSKNVKIFDGVYVGLQGPTFETKAEYVWLYRMGGDAVGMSTVPEVIVAKHMGMQVFGMSVITDLGIREDMNKITHEEVLEAANAAAPIMAGIFKDLLIQY